MQFELFGLKLRLEVVIVSMLIGAVLGCHLLCSCSKVSAKEGMQMLGAAVEYKMGEGVSGSWDTREQAKGPSVEWRENNHDATQSKFLSPEDSLFFFNETEFKPECCGSSYTSTGGVTAQGHTSGGCACMSKKQMDYLNTRGGNRTMGGDF